MKLVKWSALLVTLGWLFPLPALALDCKEEIKAAEGNLAQVESRMEAANEKTRKRAEGFLGDARTMIESARKFCENSSDVVDSATASGKAIVAQGNIAAARLVLKLE